MIQFENFTIFILPHPEHRGLECLSLIFRPTVANNVHIINSMD